MKNTILLFCGMIGILNCWSQSTAGIDSLLYQLQQEKTDTLRIKYLYRLGEAYKVSNLDKATGYAREGLLAAEKADWPKGKAALHLLNGNLLQQRGLIDSALSHYETALAISERIRDQTAVASALNDIGSAHYDRSDYLKAMDFFLKALDIAETAGSDHLAGIACENLGSIFSEQENSEKALDYYQRSQQHFEEWGNLQAQASVLAAIGNVYNKKKDITNTELYYHRALNLYKEINNPTGEAIIYSHLGSLYENDRLKAIEYQLRAQAIWDTINHLHVNAIANTGNLGSNYLELALEDSLERLPASARNRYLIKADSLLQLAISYSRLVNDRDNEGFFSIKLAALRELTGDFRSAAQLLKTGFQIRDSLFSQTHKNQLAEAEGRRELAARDQQIELRELALAAEKRKWIAVLAIAILVTVIGILLFLQNQQRKKTNRMLYELNEELDHSNRLKARLFAIISHDLRGPIASLVNFLEVQESFPDQLPPEQRLQYQRTLKEAATALLENMETLLIWSKEQMQSFRPVLKPVNLSELFSQLESRLRGPVNGRLQVKHPESLVVLSDENYLGSILQNILSNALKAVGKVADGRVLLQAWQENGEAVVEISDNGPGISSEATNALSDNAAGVNGVHGLGLQIIRDLAKAIPCQLHVSSQPTEGTRFLVKLPLYKKDI